MRINSLGYGPRYNAVPRWDTVRYIVVHYTANGKPWTANAAMNNCIYFNSGNVNASAHFFIDNGGVWMFADPATWSCWHVGDGHGEYGITNQNSVGIEVVQDGDEPFSAEEIGYLATLVGELMRRFGVPASRVVRHYDASRKWCPHYYTPYGSGGDAAWSKLHALITGGGEEEDDMTSEERAMLKAVYEAVCMPHDASGRGKDSNMPDRLAWMAAKQEKIMEAVGVKK